MVSRAELTDREKRVVALVAKGQTNSRIAEDLHMSVGTVKRDINNIMIKWDCYNRIQVAVQAAFRGYAEPKADEQGQTQVWRRSSDPAAV